MINLKIYKYKLINLIGSKMTIDTKKDVAKTDNEFNEKILGSLSSNVKASKILFKATNLSNNLIIMNIYFYELILFCQLQRV